MSLKYSREREVAISAARLAAVLCQSVQRDHNVEDALQKKDNSPVTVADFGAQAVVCSMLEKAFPQDPVVGEESGGELSTMEHSAIRAQVVEEVRSVVPGATSELILRWIDRGSAEGGRGRFWTLDPIDGTKGFLRREQYAVALALLEEGEVKVAVLACPALSATTSASGTGCVFAAVRGQGASQMALHSGQVLAVHASSEREPRNARIVESVELAHGDHDAHERIKQALAIERASVRMDSQAKYGVLARGGAEIYLRMPTSAEYRENLWDQAAGALLIEEAGGRVSDAKGQSLDWTTGRKLRNNQGIIATNGLLHEAVLEAVQASG